MPCNTTNRSEIDLSKASPDILKAALVKSGFTITIDQPDKISAQDRKTGNIFAWQKGQAAYVSGSYGREQAAGIQITKNYSAAAVEYAAKRNGWTLKQTAPNQYEAIRR